MRKYIHIVYKAFKNMLNWTYYNNTRKTVQFMTALLISWLLLQPFNYFHSAVSLHNLTVNSLHLMFIVDCASTTYSSLGKGVVLLNNIMTTILEKHNLFFIKPYMFYIVIQNCIICVLNSIMWHLCQRPFWLS